jgi:hypothetical protein
MNKLKQISILVLMIALLVTLGSGLSIVTILALNVLFALQIGITVQSVLSMAWILNIMISAKLLNRNNKNTTNIGVE